MLCKKKSFKVSQHQRANNGNQCGEHFSQFLPGDFGRFLCIDPIFFIDVYETGTDADSCRKWIMPWSIRLDEPGTLHSYVVSHVILPVRVQ